MSIPQTEVDTPIYWSSGNEMYLSIQCIYSQLFNISEPVSIQRHQSEPQDSLPTPRAYIKWFILY